MRQSRFSSGILGVFFLLAQAALAGERSLVVSKKDFSHASGKLGTYRALIIGINDYKDNAIPDLKTAVNDAREIERILREKYGFQTKMLLDRQATLRAIHDELRRTAADAKSDDSLLIYYAGHGDLDRQYGDGWWVPVDAKGGDPITYLDNVQVQRAMANTNARHVLLISDSCYSGSLFGATRALPPAITDNYYLSMYNEKSRWGMTSGNKTPVSDQGTGGHSVFAYQLLRELRNNNQPYISAQEIYTRIAPVIGNNSEQTPLCLPIRNTGDQGGNFVFVASLGKPAVSMQTELPSAPPAASDLGDMDAIIRNREAARKQWAEWQARMEANYAKARTYDGNAELTPVEKAAFWSQFLTAFGSDNPYSTADEDMRSFARSRESHWASVAPTPKPAPAPRKSAPPASAPAQAIEKRPDHYVANANGVVIDKNTGLEWYAGPDKAMTWTDARAWVRGLSIGGSGWRMPSQEELKTLYEKGAGSRNMTPLLKTTGWFVWSGDIRDESSAWTFNFFFGKPNWLRNSANRNDGRAFAVRSRG